MLNPKLIAATTLLLLATSCASVHDIGKITDPAVHGVGTPSAPAATWTPPAKAAPPPVPSPSDLTLPPAGALELAQIVDLALSNNPLTRTTWLQARVSEANLGSVRAAQRRRGHDRRRAPGADRARASATHLRNDRRQPASLTRHHRHGDGTSGGDAVRSRRAAAGRPRPAD